MIPLTQERIEEWVKKTTGVFSLKDIYSELRLEEEELKTYARVAIGRLAQKHIVVSINSRDGLYRLVDTEAPVIDWKDSSKNYFPIKWPFGLEEYFKMPRRGIAVIGGVWNAGKSAFAHNLLALNYKEYPDKIRLYDSEHSKEELADRLSKFPDWQYWPSDCVREKESYFEDVVWQNKDGLNIIDYLVISKDYYQVDERLRAIRKPLDGGIAVAMLQKPRGRDLPVGGEQAMAIPRVVLAIDQGQLTIVKAKVWAERGVNPNGKKWSFKLVGGEKFVDIQEVF